MNSIECGNGGPTAVLTLRMKTRDLNDEITADHVGRSVLIQGTAQLYSVEAADWMDTERQIALEFLSIKKLELLPEASHG